MILGFPTNQFGHQENSSGETEIMNALKHVRPGNGFEPKCIMFDKVRESSKLFQMVNRKTVIHLQVIANGEGEHPVFTWLKNELPVPSDDSESLMGDPKFIVWKPVRRSDIAWNFEKFLINSEGEAVKRYSKSFQTAHISKDIDALI